MEQKGTFWRTGGKLINAGCEMLTEGKDIERIVIASIEYKDEHDMGGRKEKGVWIANFAPNAYTTLPMILNSTNRKRIAKMFWDTMCEDGAKCEGRIDLLYNIAVRMTKERCRDVQDGGETWGLRISKTPAAPAPALDKLTPKHPNWAKCISYIVKSGKLDDIKGKYELSAENETLLMTEVEAQKSQSNGE